MQNSESDTLRIPSLNGKGLLLYSYSNISAACDGLVYKQSLTAGWRVTF